MTVAKQPIIFLLETQHEDEDEDGGPMRPRLIRAALAGDAPDEQKVFSPV